MKTQHTQGEWKAVFQEGRFPQVECENFDQGTINCCSATSFQENAANAKLIAAAPELLEEHISDLPLLRQAIDYIKNEKYDFAIGHLETILATKESVIKKATS